MMTMIEYSHQAVEDLKQIQSRIKVNWGDESATKILQNIFVQINRLKQFPFSGTNLAEMIDVPTNYRYIYVEKNYVFYYIDSDKVRIVRILNERQDFLYQLFERDLKSVDEEYNDQE